MTYAALMALRAVRDRRYALRRLYHAPHPVSETEATVIRAWRLHEAAGLTPPAAAKAAADIARSWMPPRLGRA